MTTRQRHESQLLPIANYSSAIAKAVEWLGDRYLLAKPINATPNRDTPAAAPMASHLSRRFHWDIGNG